MKHRFWEWPFQLKIGRLMTLCLIGDVVRLYLFDSQTGQKYIAMGRVTEWCDTLSRWVSPEHVHQIDVGGILLEPEEAQLACDCFRLHKGGWRSLPHARGYGRVVYGSDNTRSSIIDPNELMGVNVLRGTFEEVLHFSCRVQPDRRSLALCMLPRKLKRTRDGAVECTACHSEQWEVEWKGQEPMTVSYTWLSSRFNLCFVGCSRARLSETAQRLNGVLLQQAVEAAQCVWLDAVDPKSASYEKVELLWPAPFETIIRLLVVGKEEIREYTVGIWDLLEQVQAIRHAFNQGAKSLPDIRGLNGTALPLTDQMKFDLCELLE